MLLTDLYSQFYANSAGRRVRQLVPAPKDGSMQSPAQFLGDICSGIDPEFPDLPPSGEKQQIDRCFQVWIDTAAKAQDCDPSEIVDRVVRILFERLRLNQSDDRQIRALWSVYYENACDRVAINICRHLPEDRRHENFWNLLTERYLLGSRDENGQLQQWIKFPHLIFRRFTLNNPHPNLLQGLNGWSFRTIRNAVNSALRDGRVFTTINQGRDPYIGLSDLGVLANSSTSYTQICMAVNLLNISHEILREIAFKKYPNPTQSSLKEQITNSLKLHIFDGMGANELSKRSEQLVRSLREYQRSLNPTTSVNRLAEEQFEAIGDLYQQKITELVSGNQSSKKDIETINNWYQDRKRNFQLSCPDRDLPAHLQTIDSFRTYLSSRPLLDGAAVEVFLRAIGRTIRNYVGGINAPRSTDAPILGSDNQNTTLLDIYADENSDPSESPDEFVIWENYNQKVPQIDRHLDEFFRLPPSNPQRPSHQQILWLRYGLSLNMTEISSELHSNFGLAHPNPGGASARAKDAINSLTKNLIVSFHQAEVRSNLITESEIQARIAKIRPLLKGSRQEPSLLRGYFFQVVGRVAQSLGIQPHSAISEADRAKFTHHLTKTIEKLSRLDLSSSVAQQAIEKLIARFLQTPT